MKATIKKLVALYRPFKTRTFVFALVALLFFVISLYLLITSPA